MNDVAGPSGTAADEDLPLLDVVRDAMALIKRALLDFGSTIVDAAAASEDGKFHLTPALPLDEIVRQAMAEATRSRLGQGMEPAVDGAVLGAGIIALALSREPAVALNGLLVAPDRQDLPVRNNVLPPLPSHDDAFCVRLPARPGRTHGECVVSARVCHRLWRGRLLWLSPARRLPRHPLSLLLLCHALVLRPH